MVFVIWFKPFFKCWRKNDMADTKHAADRMVSMAVEGPSSGIMCHLAQVEICSAPVGLQANIDLMHLVASRVEELKARKAQKGSQDQLLLARTSTELTNCGIKTFPPGPWAQSGGDRQDHTEDHQDENTEAMDRLSWRLSDPFFLAKDPSEMDRIVLAIFCAVQNSKLMMELSSLLPPQMPKESSRSSRIGNNHNA